MKKLLLLLFLAALLSACQKQSDMEPLTQKQDSIHFVISTSPNTSYDLKSTIMPETLIGGTNPKPSIEVYQSSSKTQSMAVRKGQMVLFNWMFILNKQYKGSGSITVKYRGETILSVDGYGGSNSVIIP